MKLLVVIHYPAFGGPHNRAMQLSSVLEENGWQTTVMLPDENGNAADRLKEAGIDIIQIPLHRARMTLNVITHLKFFLGFVREVFRIKKIISSNQFDVVLIGGLMNPHAAFASLLARVPLVWQIVDSRTPGLFIKLLMPLVRKLSHTVMFNGKGVQEMHLEGKPLNIPSFVYYPPVKTMTRFLPDEDKRYKMRKNLGIPRDAKVVGCVANLNPQKGIEYFIRSAALINKAMNDCWFVLIGASYSWKEAYMQLIRNEIESSGIPDGRFLILGERSNVEDYYPVMDVKLITSVPKSEGTTTTAMEAMSCEVPVVATNVGSIADVVVDDVTGYLVAPLDPEAVASKTIKILNDVELKSDLGVAARKVAVEKFDIKVCADVHFKAFKAALNCFKGK